MYMNHFKSFRKWIPGRIIDKLSRTLYRIEINDNVRLVHVSSIRKSKLSDKYLPNDSTSSQAETRLPEIIIKKKIVKKNHNMQSKCSDFLKLGRS